MFHRAGDFLRSVAGRTREVVPAVPRPAIYTIHRSKACTCPNFSSTDTKCCSSRRGFYPFRSAPDARGRAYRSGHGVSFAAPVTFSVLRLFCSGFAAFPQLFCGCFATGSQLFRCGSASSPRFTGYAARKRRSLNPSVCGTAFKMRYGKGGQMGALDASGRQKTGGRTILRRRRRDAKENETKPDPDGKSVQTASESRAGQKIRSAADGKHPHMRGRGVGAVRS